MIGFGRDDGKETPDVLIMRVDEPEEPVKSLVRIRFETFDRELTYFNELFDLKEGDRVFVSGKLAGKVGYITSVTTKFRIRLSDYERVIAVAQTPIHGSYVPVMDKMLSYDNRDRSEHKRDDCRRNFYLQQLLRKDRQRRLLRVRLSKDVPFCLLYCWFRTFCWEYTQ